MIRRRILVAILVGLALTTAKQSSALQLDSTYLATIRMGINLTVTERFDEGKQLFQSMIDHDTTDHAAYLFLAGVWHGEMFDREDYSSRDQFDRLIDKALELADQAIAQNCNPAWAHLTKGNAYAYDATLETKTGSWWGALRKGLAAKSEYLQALRIDSTLYDAYLGLGSYHYWKSVKTEFINWLPFVPDYREEGITELQLAIDSSLFSGDLAANSLLWICLDDGRSAKAYEIARRLHDKFPDSRLFTWGLAFASYSSGRYRDAIDAFGRILDLIESQPGQSNFNTIECRYHRARIYLLLAEDDKAILELQTLLNYPVSDEVRSRQKGTIERARELLSKLRR